MKITREREESRVESPAPMLRTAASEPVHAHTPAAVANASDQAQHIAQLESVANGPVQMHAAAGPPVVQRAFDKATLEAAINLGTSVERMGGQSDGAWLLETNHDEFPMLVVKPSDSKNPLMAAELAAELGIQTPLALIVDKATVSAKLTALGAREVVGKSYVIAMQYAHGAKTLSKDGAMEGVGKASLGKLGEIASFDLLIGKQDLFENYAGADPKIPGYEPDLMNGAENFENLMMKNGAPIAIDLGVNPDIDEKAIMAHTRKDIIDGLVGNPTALQPYVKDNVFLLLKKAGAPVSLVDKEYGIIDRRQRQLDTYQLQRGMLVMLVAIGTKAAALKVIQARHQDAKDNPKLGQAIDYIASKAKAAATAIETLDAFIVQKQAELDAALAKEAIDEKEKARIKAEQDAKDAAAKEAVKGCCFLTTACTHARGLPDDCEELTTLRAFRDGYMAALEEGPAMFAFYYWFSPLIVKAVEQCGYSDQVYDLLYGVVADCVAMIKADDDAGAYKAYVELVLQLRDQFTPKMIMPPFVQATTQRLGIA